ncbi:MAG: B12-binding domain-containing radical SAM protein [Planctomycetota bacterium]|jgi:radical SAM superfamily enzyme YgiQ (UPF0313 family)
MRILFVHPRWERFLEARPELSDLPYARQLDSFRVAPLSIPTVAALTPPGIDVEVVDDFTESIDFDDRPDLVAISAFTPQATRAFEIADAFRARGVRVVMGGIHASVLPEEAAAHSDAVVVGEAEGLWETVLEDARRGSLRRSYRRESPPALEGQPFPRRDFFRQKGLKSICVVQTCRGCGRRCPGCVLPGITSREIRRRPVEEVVREIRELEEPSFYLSEESLLFPDARNREWADRFLGELEGSGKTFFLATYPFLLKGIELEFLQRMERAGNRQFYIVFGVDDAGPDAVWSRIDKVKQGLERVREAGISVMGSFALGGEEDGPESFEKLFALARELEINLAEFFLLTPYPGTPLFRDLEAQGRILTREWRLYNGAHPVFEPRRMTTEQLMEGYISLWRAFYGPLDEYSSTLRFIRGFGPQIIRLRNEKPGN